VRRQDLQLVLGLITTKTPDLEREDEILSRIEEAGRYVTPGQLCLSPQCGFASTEEGNLLTEEDQFKKLALVVKIAHQAWPYGG
jgi:5-methyltetrahydropteroyltriglutamate--homocysteine methyltransferase